MNTATQAASDLLPFVRYGRTSRLAGRDAGDNVSRTEQFSNVDSIAARFELPTLPGEFYDADVSGSTFERPEWERAIAMVRAGQAGGIIAFDFKRIGRASTAEMLAMVADVESVGGKLYDGTGRLSVDDADAELMTTVKAMMARREWRERRDYMAASVRNAIGRGVHLGIPFGYARTRKGTPLVINEAEAPVVRFVFAQRAAGWSWQRIADALNDGDTPPRPCTRHGVTWTARWTHKTTRQLVVGRRADVGNEVYLGVAWNGEHRTAGAHPAIITDRKLYRLATEGKGTKPVVGATDGYVLTGLVRCAGCGHSMVRDVDYYRCRAAQNGMCDAPANANAAQIEAYAVAEFKARHLDMELVGIVDNAEVVAAEAALAQSTTKVSALMDMADALGSMDEDERGIFDGKMAAARAALRDAKSDLRTAQGNARGADLPTDLDADVFDTAPVDDRRGFLSTVFACVVVRRSVRHREPVTERARILARDDAPTNPTALRLFVTGL